MPEHDPTGRTLDEEGIPDLEGPLPEEAATGDGHEGVPPPSDRPASLEFGTTVREQREGESLDDRLDRERPDLGEPGALDPPFQEGVETVAPDDEDAASPDDEAEMLGTETTASGQMASPEEAAMHVEGEGTPPGAGREEAP